MSDIRSRFEKLKEEPEIVKVVKPKVVEPKVEMADSPAGSLVLPILPFRLLYRLNYTMEKCSAETIFSYVLLNSKPLLQI